MPTYATGRVEPSNLDHLRELSARRHAKKLAGLPLATEPTWDSVALGWIPPIKNQASCGSCWDFSGTCVVEVAYWKNGLTNVILSEEYTLSCGRNGGCNGDDNTTVLEWAKKTGLPLTADYGGYTARADRCKFTNGMTLYKIDDWGFADKSGGQGVTPVQDIKDAIKQYGCVGCAIAADDAFMNIRPGTVFQGSGSRNIDHDVALVGWDDSKGAWKLRNSWGDWVDAGYCWIKYGANLVGTESVWCHVNSQAPPIDWASQI